MNECPNCKNDLRVFLWQRFYEYPARTNFEAICPNCLTNISVEICPVPEFKITPVQANPVVQLIGA